MYPWSHQLLSLIKLDMTCLWLLLHYKVQNMVHWVHHGAPCTLTWRDYFLFISVQSALLLFAPFMPSHPLGRRLSGNGQTQRSYLPFVMPRCISGNTFISPHPFRSTRVHQHPSMNGPLADGPLADGPFVDGQVETALYKVGKRIHHHHRKLHFQLSRISTKWFWLVHSITSNYKLHWLQKML